MAANTNINSLLIDNTFPIANKSQSSQGFRSNWSAIQNNFNYAKSDILNLQNKTITLTGDISGTSPIFDSGPSGITLKSTFTPSGLDNLNPGNFVSEFEKILNFTVDTRGLITNITQTDRDKTFFTSGNINAISNLDQTKQYSGITSLNIPKITYNEYGLITSIEENLIQGFGITNLYMPKNSILIGNNSSISAFLPAPSEQSVLAFNGENISWQQNVNITQVKSGNMIYTNLDSSGTLSISVTYSNLNYSNVITDSTEFPTYDGVNYNLTKMDDIFQYFSKNYTYDTDIFLDKAPKLGGNLDVNNFSIINSQNGIINLNSDNINLTANNNVDINGLLFGKITPPSSKSVLTVDNSGNISIQDLPTLTNFYNNLTNIILTEDNQSQQIISSTSLNYFIQNVGYTNLNLVFDRTNYNTNQNYNLVFTLYFEITDKDMVLNFAGDNNSIVYLNGDTSETIGLIENGTFAKSNSTFTSDPSVNIQTSSGGTGSGATFTVTTTSENVYTPASVTLNAAGSGYAAGDTIILTNIGTITVSTVNSSGAITAITSKLSTNSLTTDMAGSAVTGTTTGSGTGATFTVTSTKNIVYIGNSATINNTGSGYKVGDILTIGNDIGTYTITSVTGQPTSLTLSQNYIYKLQVEYYGNNCWIMDVIFKSQKN